MHYTQRAVWRKRGGGSCDTEQVTSYVALVRALPIPPPAWSRCLVGGNARATLGRYEFVKWTADCPHTDTDEWTANLEMCRVFTTFVKADSSPLLLESVANRESLAHYTKRDSNRSVKIETSAKYSRYFDSAELWETVGWQICSRIGRENSG